MQPCYHHNADASRALNTRRSALGNGVERQFLMFLDARATKIKPFLYRLYCRLLMNKADDEMPRGRTFPANGLQQTVQPAMLCVCKQMHEEAASILYEQNEFCVYADFYWFKLFLSLIGRDNAALIRRILVRSFGILPDLDTELLKTIDSSCGPVKVFEKVTIVYSRHHLSHLVRSDLL
jgi:hypothetical protein